MKIMPHKEMFLWSMKSLINSLRNPLAQSIAKILSCGCEEDWGTTKKSLSFVKRYDVPNIWPGLHSLWFKFCHLVLSRATREMYRPKIEICLSTSARAFQLMLSCTIWVKRHGTVPLFSQMASAGPHLLFHTHNIPAILLSKGTENGEVVKSWSNVLRQFTKLVCNKRPQLAVTSLSHDLNILANALRQGGSENCYSWWTEKNLSQTTFALS